MEADKDGKERVNRINYEICVLQALREGSRSKEIWVVGAERFRNPDEDLPVDFRYPTDSLLSSTQLTLRAGYLYLQYKEVDGGRAEHA